MVLLPIGGKDMDAAGIAAVITAAAGLVTAVGALIHSRNTRNDLADHLFSEDHGTTPQQPTDG